MIFGNHPDFISWIVPTVWEDSLQGIIWGRLRKFLRAARIPKTERENYMKYTFGKIGLGLAGAVAAVGLMSAGIQTAQAQLELVPAPPGGSNIDNPTVKQIVNSSEWSYTYTLGAVWTGSGNLVLSTSGPDSNFFSMLFPGYVANSVSWAAAPSTTGYSNVDTSTSWSTPTVVGDLLTFTYDNSSTTVTITPSASPPSGSVSAPVLLGQFTLDSTIGPSSLPQQIFSSSINEYTSNGFFAPVTESQSAVGPALPLPAAFWPGLMTLGGMAVVGGLRLRRRAL